MDDDIYYKMKHKSVKWSHAVQLSHFPNNYPIFLWDSFVLYILTCTCMHMLHLYFIIHAAYLFSRKLFALFSDNSLVKVPGLQPAWMMISIRKWSTSQLSGIMQYKWDIFQIIIQIFLWDSFVMHIFTCMHMLHLYFIIHAAYLYLRKLFALFSDNSLVKVPGLQPAWMMISIRKWSTSQLSGIMQYKWVIFQIIVQIFQWDSFVLYILTCMHMLHLYFIIHAAYLYSRKLFALLQIIVW